MSVKNIILESFKNVGKIKIDFDSSMIVGTFEKASPGIKKHIKGALQHKSIESLTDIEKKMISDFLDGTSHRSILLDVNGIQAAIKIVGGNIHVASLNKLEFEKQLELLHS